MKTFLDFFSKVLQKIVGFWRKNEQVRSDSLKAISISISKYGEALLDELCTIKGNCLVDGVNDLLNIASDYCRISNPSFSIFNEELFCYIKDVRSFVSDFNLSKSVLNENDINESYSYLCFCLRDLKSIILKAIDLDATYKTFDYLPNRLSLPVDQPFYIHICTICKTLYAT